MPKFREREAENGWEKIDEYFEFTPLLEDANDNYPSPAPPTYWSNMPLAEVIRARTAIKIIVAIQPAWQTEKSDVEQSPHPPKPARSERSLVKPKTESISDL
jgi:hypothetical protein